jgi:DNA (cytosine-5)-methyltransferase 1
MANYSDIRNALGISNKSKLTTELAYLTHYFQNSLNGVSKAYKGNAISYINSHPQKDFFRKLDLVKTKWDIPFPPPKNPRFKFIDLFAGIGGFRIALQSVGGKCVFSSEINNGAKKTYESNFGEIPFGDIRDFTGSHITDKQLNQMIPDHDLLAAGFPCQPFSLAGVSARNFLGQLHGFSDIDKGNLFFDIARIVSVKKPSVVFLENVKNFWTHDDSNTYQTVKRTMKDLGYEFYADIINANTLVPQSRQRFYMVCIKGDHEAFQFPELTGSPKKLKTILEKNVPNEFTISDKLWTGHINRTKRNIERGTGFTAHTADLEKPSKTLVARYGKDGKECLIPQKGKNPRKLTPRECARLQGFPESFILPSSNAAAYMQFGNSVAVPVIEKIARQILTYLKK